jgi:hypothetical protein
VSPPARQYSVRGSHIRRTRYSSPVGARGRVSITGCNGTTVGIRHGGTFEVLATNTLDDGFDASAALVDGHIFLRDYRYPVRHRRAMSWREAAAGKGIDQRVTDGQVRLEVQPCDSVDRPLPDVR